MQYKDYYQIMGVVKDASQDEIKRSYRKLARKYHPDVSKEADAEAKFKEVGEAYEVLKDPEKRTAYDQLGENWKSGQDFRPPPDWGAGYEFSGGGSQADEAAAFSDFFSSLFGQAGAADYAHAQAGRPHPQSKGEDHHAKVMIDIEDAFKGAARSISLRSAELDAQGHVVTRDRTLNVKIPKGVKQGQSIRLAGQGSPSMVNGLAGDLYLEIDFNPHPFYRVEGRDIYLELPIAPWEAALGAKVKVPTPAGKLDLTIPANSSSGRKLRLKGRGIPGKIAGDLYAVLRIALPPANTESARQSYKLMAKEMAFNPRHNLGV